MADVMRVHFSILLITCCLMLTMMMQAHCSNSIGGKLAKTFIRSFAMITFCAVLDWLRLVLNGTAVPIYIHTLVVSMEYACAPMVVLLIIRVLGRLRENYFLIPLLALNVLLQFSTSFTNWIFYIDDANCFVRGDYFRIYVAIYTIAIIAMYRSVYLCSHEYQNRNYKMLLLSILSLTIGVGMNEFVGESHTTFLAVAIASVMFYIYFMEIGLQTDALTKLLNRRSYNNHLRQLDYDTAIVLFDVNKFKGINDTYGHKTGDVVLQKVAGSIRFIFGNMGYIYRIGGDEFAMILKPGQLEGLDYPAMVESLQDRLEGVRLREYPIMPSVSMGYAVYKVGMDKAEVVSLADQQMYIHKNGNSRF